MLVAPLAPAEAAAAKIQQIPAASTPVPTAFYDTVAAAAKYLTEKSEERHRRVILVISDGDDNFSNLVRDLTKAEYEASQKGSESPAAQAQFDSRGHARVEHEGSYSSMMRPSIQSIGGRRSPK